MQQEKSFGQIGYEAYAKSTSGKTFDGRDMPTWLELVQRSPKVVKAWEDAGAEILVQSAGEHGDTFSFSIALHFLKLGKRVARKGWNGKDMWLTLWRAGTYASGSELFENCPALNSYAYSTRSRNVDVAGSIVMKAADGCLVFGWLASQTDMLADDWVMLE